MRTDQDPCLGHHWDLPTTVKLRFKPQINQLTQYSLESESGFDKFTRISRWVCPELPIYPNTVSYTYAVRYAAAALAANPEKSEISDYLLIHG